jgi:uncharacterized protein
MISDLWISLPVKNIEHSKAFFKEIGFTFNSRYGNHADSASLTFGKSETVVMLFNESTFKSFIDDKDLKTNGTEVLISIGVDTKEDVDQLARKAVAAGGKSNHKPGQMKGWMYGCLFTDLDGHKWNILYMDMNRMPKS